MVKPTVALTLHAVTLPLQAEALKAEMRAWEEAEMAAERAAAGALARHVARLDPPHDLWVIATPPYR